MLHVSRTEVAAPATTTDADPLQVFLQQLALFHESQHQFVQRVQRYRQWVVTYHTHLHTYLARTQPQEHPVTPASAPITVVATAIDVTDAQWERVASLLTISQSR